MLAYELVIDHGPSAYKSINNALDSEYPEYLGIPYGVDEKYGDLPTRLGEKGSASCMAPLFWKSLDAYPGLPRLLRAYADEAIGHCCIHPLAGAENTPFTLHKGRLLFFQSPVLNVGYWASPAGMRNLRGRFFNYIWELLSDAERLQFGWYQNPIEPHSLSTASRQNFIDSFEQFSKWNGDFASKRAELTFEELPDEESKQTFIAELVKRKLDPPD